MRKFNFWPKSVPFPPSRRTPTHPSPTPPNGSRALLRGHPDVNRVVKAGLQGPGAAVSEHLFRSRFSLAACHLARTGTGSDLGLSRYPVFFRSLSKAVKNSSTFIQSSPEQRPCCRAECSVSTRSGLEASSSPWLLSEKCSQCDGEPRF